MEVYKLCKSLLKDKDYSILEDITDVDTLKEVIEVLIAHDQRMFAEMLIKNNNTKEKNK